MSMINKEVSDFSVQAYQNGEFKTVTKADILGKWSVFFFYPADFTFVCPTELEDLQNKYSDFQAAGCEIYSVSCDTHFVHKAWHDASERIQTPILSTKHGMIPLKESVRSLIQCWQILPTHSARILKC